MRKVNDLLDKEIQKCERRVEDLDASLEESKRRTCIDSEEREELLLLIAEMKQAQAAISK